MKTRAVLLAILGAATAMGQLRPRLTPPPPAHTTATHVRRVPLAKVGPPAASDAEIEKAIRARLAKSTLAADKIQVHVQNGVATFDGHTDVIQRKGAATRMAKSAGAAAVVNKIQMSEAAKKRAAANLAKGRRRVQVKRSEVANRR